MSMHAVSGTDPLNFTDDLMYDDSSRIHLERYKKCHQIHWEELHIASGQ